MSCFQNYILEVSKCQVFTKQLTKYASGCDHALRGRKIIWSFLIRTVFGVTELWKNATLSKRRQKKKLRVRGNLFKSQGSQISGIWCGIMQQRGQEVSCFPDVAKSPPSPALLGTAKDFKGSRRFWSRALPSFRPLSSSQGRLPCAPRPSLTLGSPSVLTWETRVAILAPCTV